MLTPLRKINSKFSMEIATAKVPWDRKSKFGKEIMNVEEACP